jgi:hypothetical protein
MIAADVRAPSLLACGDRAAAIPREGFRLDP